MPHHYTRLYDSIQYLVPVKQKKELCLSLHGTWYMMECTEYLQYANNSTGKKRKWLELKSHVEVKTVWFGFCAQNWLQFLLVTSCDCKGWLWALSFPSSLLSSHHWMRLRCFGERNPRKRQCSLSLPQLWDEDHSQCYDVSRSPLE